MLAGNYSFALGCTEYITRGCAPAVDAWRQAYGGKFPGKMHNLRLNEDQCQLHVNGTQQKLVLFACITHVMSATNGGMVVQGRMPLHHAAYANDVETIKMLIRFGADATARDHRVCCPSFTALHPRLALYEGIVSCQMHVVI